MTTTQPTEIEASLIRLASEGITETEAELIQRARQSGFAEAFVVGECASKWGRKWAKGRGDADFAALIGSDGDAVQKRRRVWETFGDVAESYRNLWWSHFYASLTWDDAPECLAWADENEATVGEMAAWRRLQHGETLDPDGFRDDESERVVRGVSATERKLEEGDTSHAAPPAESQAALSSVTSGTMATLSDRDPAETYSPFKSGSAGKSARPPSEDNGDGASRDAVLIRRTCNTVTAAIGKADDREGFVAELLAACWRADPDATAHAVIAFARANSIAPEVM